MRLSSDEILKLTKYLADKLKSAGFKVSINRFGSIVSVSKFGVRCCPAILNSKEDGKHGFAYLTLVSNKYDKSDLGSCVGINSLSKYGGNSVHIDLHNCNQVIDTFVSDLSKDYVRALNKDEDLSLTEDSNNFLVPGVSVKIKDTGIVFDGMDGVIESVDGDKVTVMVNFNADHRVRNTFKKEQLDF